MTDLSADDSMPLEIHDHFVDLIDRFEEACQENKFEVIQDLVGEVDPRYQHRLTIELLAVELEFRSKAGQPRHLPDYIERFPEHESKLRILFSRYGTDERTVRNIASQELQPGCRLGDYEIAGLLGTGGMGVVYRAQQLSLSRPVALKLLPAVGFTASSLLRFHREASAAGRLNHSNIVAVHAMDTVDGISFLVMELLEGPTLAEVIDTLRKTKNDSDADDRMRISAARVSQLGLSLRAEGTEHFDTIATLMAGVSEGLDYAHQHGVLHRDIKPANLMFDSGSELKIADFGLAKLSESDAITHSGGLLGTPQYMSPERLSSDNRHAVDRKSDVYSCGATLYEFLTLKPAYSGPLATITSQVLSNDAPEARQIDRNIPQDLDTICQKAMAKDPALRYPTAGELAQDLRRYVDRLEIRAKRSGPIKKLARFVRHNSKSFIAATAFASLALIAAMLFLRMRETRRNELIADVIDHRHSLQSIEATAIELRNDPAGKRQLVRLFENPSQDEDTRVRSALAIITLAPNGSSHDLQPIVGYLSQQLLAAAPSDFLAIRRILSPFKDRLVPRFWDVVGDKKTFSELQRFRAACALADFDPSAPQWQDKQLRRFATQSLLDSTPDQALCWGVALRSQSSPWLAESIIDSFTNSCAGHRPGKIVIHPSQFPTVHSIVQAQPNSFVELAERNLVGYANRVRELKRHDEGPSIDGVLRPYPAARLAAVTTILAKLGRWEPTWRALSHQSLLDDPGDPRVRSYLIRFLPLNDIDPSRLVNRYRIETDAATKSAILMSLGGYTKNQLSTAARRRLQPELIETLQSATDAELHSSAEWLLRKWRVEFPTSMVRVETSRQWFATSMQETFIEFSPTRFRMGVFYDSERHDSDQIAVPHVRQIGYPFAVSSTEVTKANFERFAAERGLGFRMPQGHAHWKGERVPVSGVTWHEATQYCNWLSENEGLPPEQWCYDPQGNPRANHLERFGFRLPTEAEWEFACRGNTTTPRFYGTEENLLEQYACHGGNSKGFPSPVASFRPNRFGMFDMLGNVEEWCDDVFETYEIEELNGDGKAAKDRHGAQQTNSDQRRSVRGFHFDTQPFVFRSGGRRNASLDGRSRYRGFRVAKTLFSSLQSD